MKSSPTPLIILTLFCLTVPACQKLEAQHQQEPQHREDRKVVATSPVVKDVITTEQYVCQIHSCRHIEVCALESGYLEAIPVKEGQAVKQGDLMFKILPTLYQAKLDAEKAEAQLAQIEFNNSQKLHAQNVVSEQDVALAQAKLSKAQAQVELAQAELNFTEIKAPFDGIMNRLLEQQGSMIEEGDTLTSLSDNSVMWVYFNVREARYLEYQAALDAGENSADLQIELELADRSMFPHAGKIGAIEADFNNETGNIAFRADFPNPDRLLRNGQTGSVLIHNTLHNAIVIPQRATYDILDKRYVFVVGEDDVVHQREIQIQHEMEDVYVIGEGITAADKIVLEGVRQVRDGDTLDYEYREPEEVLSDLKYEAE